MYFGSVKFYKHLIYAAMVIISVLAIIGLVFLISLIVPDKHAEAAGPDKTSTQINNNGQNNANVSSNKENTPSDESKKATDNNNSSVNKDLAKQEDNNQKNNDVASNEKQELPVFETYPQLACVKPIIKVNEKKTAYFTFDDGPSASTAAILDVLKKHNIKATFFVVTGSTNTSNLYLLKQISDDGHAIGIHSHKHDYSKIYESKDTFLEDMNSAYSVIYEQASIKPTIIRFPGGSVNGFNTNVINDITAEILSRNFTYFDWNVSFEDAKKNVTAEEIYNSAMSGINKYNGNDIVILAHDHQNNTETLIALERVICELESYGYEFSALDNTVEPIIFSHK